MYFVVYASSATQRFTEADLRALLLKARANNARDGITGLLLYRGGNFMQVLEGTKTAALAKYQRIARDPRHRGLVLLLSGEEKERQFPDFSMGCHDLDSAVLRDVPGFSEFLNAPLTGAEFSGDPTRAQRLLMTFKRTTSSL